MKQSAIKPKNFILNLALLIFFFSSINSFSQNPDQVRLQGIVRDTSGHVVENANARIWKADNAAIYETTETDFWGEYTKDISTPVEEIPEAEKIPIRVLNNGNSNHIGIEGTISEAPQQIIITDVIGRAIRNIPFNYDVGSKVVSAEWKSETPGIYFATIIGQNDKESIKFLTTESGMPPSLGNTQAIDQTNYVSTTNNKKSMQALSGEPIKYYIEISADGNEAISFNNVLDSIEVYPGEIGYPEHVVTPNLPTYTAPVQGEVTIAGNPVGPNFKVVLTPEVGDAQELFTDANSRFSTTFTIPYQAFPYDPATIDVDATAEPTATSIQTTNGNNSISITDSDTPFTLDMAVDSAWVNLFGTVAQTDVTGTITVDGKEVYAGSINGAYDINSIKTIKDNVDVNYHFQKYHYEDVNENKNVAVWSDTEFNPTFTFIPAEYTATITGDSGADITITKNQGGEELWNYVSTGTDDLSVLQRNELDSILVDMHAELTDKEDFDTTFYMRENLPNNITFSMNDIITDPDYVRVWGNVTNAVGTSIKDIDIKFIRSANPTENFQTTTFDDGMSIYYDFGEIIPVYSEPESYDVELAVEDGRGLMPTTHTTTIPIQSPWVQRNFVIDSLPHAKLQGVIRDGDSIANRLEGVTVQFVNKANDVVLDTDVTDANGYYKSNITFSPGTEIYLLIGGKEGYLARGGPTTYVDWSEVIEQPMFAADTLQNFNWTLPRVVGKYGEGVNDTITVHPYNIAAMAKNQNIEHAMGRGANFNYEQFITNSPSVTSTTVDGWINDFKAAFPNANIVRTTSDYVLTPEQIQNYDHQTNYYPDSVITHIDLGANQTSNKYTTINGELQILYSEITLSGNQIGFNKETGRGIGLGEVGYDSFMDNDGGPITNRDKRVVTLILNQGQYRYQDEFDSFSYKNLRENE